MPINIEREMTYLRQIPNIGEYLGEALRKLQEGTNNMGQNAAIDPAGTIPPPPPVQELIVKTNGNGLVHAVINDNNAIQKNLHYFVEYDTNPAFPQPHVAHLGASRSMNPITLPANDDHGNPQSFYFRAYSQYPAGHPGDVVHFGGTTPTAVNPGGTQNMTLIPSTGSGTAPSDGQRGGSGFGKVLFRPTVATKRSVK